MLVDMPAAQQSTIRGITLPLCLFIASALRACTTILLILCDSEGYMKIIFTDVIKAQFLRIITPYDC
jgi:3-hydroxymyristoyl/3-hydroxydecanoyl-(acyl carrier protein) dehydratase